MHRPATAQGEGEGGGQRRSLSLRCWLALLRLHRWLALLARIAGLCCLAHAGVRPHMHCSLVAMAPTGEPKTAAKIENRTNCRAHPESWFLTLVSYHTVRLTSVYFQVNGNQEFYVDLSTSKTIVGQEKK